MTNLLAETTSTMTGLDIVCVSLCVMGGTMMLATAAGIATQHETQISDQARRVDATLGSSGLLTLLARFFEGWPKANATLKTLFTLSLLACGSALGIWLFKAASQ